MTTVSEATDLILQNALTLPTEQIPISECNGRILREDLIADRDFPPFDRVTMDGIAIDFATWELGNKRFAIQATTAAGAAQIRLNDPILCIEVMTGAILPSGCDTVIRYEDLKMEGGRTSPLGDRGAREGESENLPPSPLKGEHVAVILLENIEQGQNIHKRGIDRKEGDIIVNEGKRISAAEIGVAATIGKSSLLVGSLPRIAVISTGDELVDIDDTPLPHQIRKSNAHQIKVILEQYGVVVDCYHIADDAKEIEKSLKKILAEYECVVLSGGVSAGKFDYVPDALEKLGVEKLFHGVAQRPGKPFWFGVGAPGFFPGDLRSGINPNPPTVFALPGNPVSSFMCTIRYIIPWLEKTLGIRQRQKFSILAEDVNFKPVLTYFLQVKLEHHRDGRLRAHPVAGHGSGDLANLVDADAFLELEGGQHSYHEGGSYRVWEFRNP